MCASQVTAQGELDIETVPQLIHKIETIPAEAIIIDMSQVTFMDASGVNALLRTHKSLAREGRCLFLKGVAGIPFRVIQLCHLDTVFQFAETG